MFQYTMRLLGFIKKAGLIIIVTALAAGSSAPSRKFQVNGLAQGTTYHITYYASDSIVQKNAIDSLFASIDSSLSLYKEYSLVNHFNRPVKELTIDHHLKKVVAKAIQVYTDTKGMFDITVFPLTDIWGFGPRRITTLPDSQQIRTLLPCVNTRLLALKGNRLSKTFPCVQLDPNGIAQGYTVDVLAAFLERHGIQNYLVELGGEIRVKGRKPDGQKMTVSIETPTDDPFAIPTGQTIEMENGAITTSGNYRRYYESEGQRISHLLNPKTGYPIRNELISVTVYAPDAITADAYDNALMGMGLSKAMAFVEQRKTLAAHFIYLKKDGTVADTMTRRFRRLVKR